MPRAKKAPEGGDGQMAMFETLEDLDAAAGAVLAKEAEVASAQEARIGRENELHATPAWEALCAAEGREEELRLELRDLRKALQEGALNRLRASSPA